jgi:hypothetical protein
MLIYPFTHLFGLKKTSDNPVLRFFGFVTAFLAANWIAVVASYHFIEMPLMRFRDRISSARAAQ